MWPFKKKVIKPIENQVRVIYTPLVIDISLSIDKNPEKWEFFSELKHGYNIPKDDKGKELAVRYIRMKNSDGSYTNLMIPLKIEGNYILVFFTNYSGDMPARIINIDHDKKLIEDSYGKWRDNRMSKIITD